MKDLQILSKGMELPKDGVVLNLVAVGVPSFGQVVLRSFEEASALQSAFISFWNLGASEYLGGLVSDTHYISYNGRIWQGSQSDWRNAKEVAVDKTDLLLLTGAYYDLLEAKLLESV